MSSETVRLGLWSLRAFGVEVIVVMMALVWNYTTFHAGGWESLSRGVGNFLILVGAMLSSLIFGCTALIQRLRYRNTAGIKLRAASSALALHGAVVVLGLAYLISI